MDLAMPRVNGLQASRDLRRQAPGAKVLVLSAYKDDETIRQVMDAGVSGYITKHSAGEELLTAIRELSKGKSYFSPGILNRLKARGRQSVQTSNPTAAKLTPREIEVLSLIARGQPNKEIAYTLNISIKTVEKHRQATMDKLNLHDVAGLTRYAMAKGLLKQTLQQQNLSL
jgi:DNA-binding NarL/FixJ family response regulator